MVGKSLEQVRQGKLLISPLCINLVKRKAHILIFIAQQSKHLEGLSAPPVSDEKFVCVAKIDHIQGQLGPPVSDEKCVCVTRKMITSKVRCTHLN